MSPSISHKMALVSIDHIDNDIIFYAGFDAIYSISMTSNSNKKSLYNTRIYRQYSQILEKIKNEPDSKLSDHESRLRKIVNISYKTGAFEILMMMNRDGYLTLPSSEYIDSIEKAMTSFDLLSRGFLCNSNEDDLLILLARKMLSCSRFELYENIVMYFLERTKSPTEVELFNNLLCYENETSRCELVHVLEATPDIKKWAEYYGCIDEESDEKTIINIIDNMSQKFSVFGEPIFEFFINWIDYKYYSYESVFEQIDQHNIYYYIHDDTKIKLFNDGIDYYYPYIDSIRDDDLSFYDHFAEIANWKPCSKPSSFGGKSRIIYYDNEEKISMHMIKYLVEGSYLNIFTARDIIEYNCEMLVTSGAIKYYIMSGDTTAIEWCANNFENIENVHFSIIVNSLCDRFILFMLTKNISLKISTECAMSLLTMCTEATIIKLAEYNNKSFCIAAVMRMKKGILTKLIRSIARDNTRFTDIGGSIITPALNAKEKAIVTSIIVKLIKYCKNHRQNKLETNGDRRELKLETTGESRELKYIKWCIEIFDIKYLGHNIITSISRNSCNDVFIWALNNNYLRIDKTNKINCLEIATINGNTFILDFFYKHFGETHNTISRYIGPNNMIKIIGWMKNHNLLYSNPNNMIEICCILHANGFEVLHKKEIKQLLKMLDCKDTEKIVYSLMSTNMPFVIKNMELFESAVICMRSIICNMAATRNNLHMLKYIHRLGMPLFYRSSSMDYIAISCYQDKKCMACSIFYIAFINNNLEILEWIVCCLIPENKSHISEWLSKMPPSDLKNIITALL